MEHEDNGKTGKLNPARAMMQKIRENKNSLHISRVPPKTKEVFIAFADEEFLGDWGMALKWLMDGIPNQDMRLILAELDSLKEKVEELENSKTPNDEDSSSEKTKLPKTFGQKRNEKYGK